MTELPKPDRVDFADDARIFWNQLRAIELCRAVSRRDDDAASRLIAEVAHDGDEVHFIAGLAGVAVTLARTAAQQNPSATEAGVWRGLTERAKTGLHATRELAELTNTTPTNEGNDNAR